MDRAEWPSYQSSMKSIGCSVVFAEIAAGDRRWWKGVPYARRGCGVAIMAKASRVALSAEHLHRGDEHRLRAEGRLVSAIIGGPGLQIIMHSIYLSYWDGETNDRLMRIICQGSSHHIVGGDFQGPVVETSLGEVPCEEGWIAVTQVAHVEATNHPPNGEGPDP